MGEFERDHELGEVGEEAVLSLLQNHPFTIDVLDVRPYEHWQRRGVDFIWRNEEGVFALDAKTERRSTGNLFLETVSNTVTGELGWLYSSQADFIVYGFLDRNVWYFFDLEQMRRVVDQNPGFPTRRAKTPMGDGGYETEGVLVALTHPAAAALIYEISSGGASR